MSNLLQQIKAIDLGDVATRLGLSRPNGKGNYCSLHHEDKNPSVSIYQRDGIWYYKDHSSGRHGDALDLVQDMGRMSFEEARDWLCSQFGIVQPSQHQPAAEKSRAEWIADRCRQNTDRAIEYLAGRGIPAEISQAAIKHDAIGFNDWCSAKMPPGVIGHGGPAVAFIVRSLNPGTIKAVDMRYLDPALNGGLKTQTQGEKDGHPWYSHLPTLKRALTVYVVESPINALSVQAAQIPHAAALATRGVATIASIDWRILIGKKVVICMDNDKPQADGRRPGPEAAWQLHSILTDLGIAAFLVDQGEWKVNDVNDILQGEKPAKLRRLLETLEPWAIPGLPGNPERLNHRTRIFLPEHDYAVYWRYRCKEDFTMALQIEADKETGEKRETPTDLAGFRLAMIQRVSIAGATATMTGDQDTAPKEVFAVAVQTPQHGAKLVRKVLTDDNLFNFDRWQQFGPIWNKGSFMRLINIFGRVANSQSKATINFVGLAWKDGKLVVNEGPDCFFTDPDKQCPYHNLQFPSGPVEHARRVIGAYQGTFGKNAAAILLAWALGGHLKAILGFWPHCMMQADKGKGKSTLIKRLERTIAFTMFSGQSLQTEFRLLTSIGHTSHPVGWEELSARDQKIIDRAVAILQETYQFTITRRGVDLVEFLNSAPVLLAGEDVPVRAMLGKLIRVELEERGPLLPADLPVFPVRQWLEFLTGLSRERVLSLHQEIEQDCLRQCRASGDDIGARRMMTNYAAIWLSWRLLCEFAGIAETQYGFPVDLVAAMNSHIAETSADREPWIWIMETILAEIAAGRYQHPFAFDQVNLGDEVLIIRPQHIIHHIRTSPGLRDIWNALPIKSDRVFRKQMFNAGVMSKDRIDPTIQGQREFHFVALSLKALEEFGLFASKPEK